MTPCWGMMIRRTPQARITNQGVNPVGEEASRQGGGRRGYARGHPLSKRGKGGAEARRDPSQGRGGAARAGILLSAAAAGHPPWLKWRVSLGETHRPDSTIPPAQTRSGEVFQASKPLGFALSQGNQPLTLAGEILRRRNGSGLP